MKNFKEYRRGKKTAILKKATIGFIIDFETESMKSRRQFYKNFKVLGGSGGEKLTYLDSFKNEGKIKIFSDEQKLKEFIAYPRFNKYCVEVLQGEDKENGSLDLWERIKSNRKGKCV